MYWTWDLIKVEFRNSHRDNWFHSRHNNESIMLENLLGVRFALRFYIIWHPQPSFKQLMLEEIYTKFSSHGKNSKTYAHSSCIFPIDVL